MPDVPTPSSKADMDPNFEKQLRKAREGWEYEVVVNQLFTLPLL